VRREDRDRAKATRRRARQAGGRAPPGGDGRPDRRHRVERARRALSAAAEIAVRLQPRARRTEVVGERAGAVVIRVSAPPVDGKANAALCAFLADRAGVARSRVRIVRGTASRDKLVRVEGVDASTLRAALLEPWS
jgi:uncharacterized protein